MSRIDVSEAAPSVADASRVEESSRPVEWEPVAPVAPPPPAAARTPVAAGSLGWTAGRITALVIGSVFVLISLGFLGAGGTALWYDRTQRDDGYVTTGDQLFSTAGSALVTVPTDLGSPGVGWLYAPGLLDEIRIRVAQVNPGPDLFVGIGPSADVGRYLGGVSHTVIDEFWTNKVEIVPGESSTGPPTMQGFWVASATGSGAQSMEWVPTDGSWSVVVMNADGSPGVAVAADLGARIPALPWIALGMLVAGAIFATGGTLLIVGALRRRGVFRARAA